MKIVAWNMQNLKRSWNFLVDQHQSYDLALIQEACIPTKYARRQAAEWDVPWERWDLKPARYRQEILAISDQCKLTRLDREAINLVADLPTKNPIFDRWRAAAITTTEAGERFCVVCAVSGSRQSHGLAPLVAAVRIVLEQQGLDSAMPMIVAGDQTTDIDRTPQTFVDMEQLGMVRVGPEGPNFIHKPGMEQHADAWRMLNNVFVSTDLIDRVQATALNDPEETSPSYWGPSDHCRILIEVDESPPDFGGSYARWSCKQCQATTADLVHEFHVRNRNLDPRVHCARIIASHIASHRTQHAIRQESYADWSCDHCAVTVKDLVESFKRRYPAEDPQRYLGRIVGGHKSYHTRSSARVRT
ncbi:MAG: hypothetical protein OXD50_12205 [Chloroflexi bacterium]|nr:hypothetical protein [Chloroflexota bacterium]